MWQGFSLSLFGARRTPAHQLYYGLHPRRKRRTPTAAGPSTWCSQNRSHASTRFYRVGRDAPEADVDPAGFLIDLRQESNRGQLDFEVGE